MRAASIPLVAALVTLVVHGTGNPHYGFFRDELHFIICGLHPAWGYVDQPPVVLLSRTTAQPIPFGGLARLPFGCHPLPFRQSSRRP